MVERFNQTLLKMLGTLEECQKSDWKTHVPTLVHAYNCTLHDSTGYSPYYLMFGRHPRLAIDAFLGLRPVDVNASSSSEFIRKLTDRLQHAYTRARQATKKSSAKQKKAYDLKVRSSQLQPGDMVLVRNVCIRGKQKLADRWERQPYIVKRQPIPSIPVYEVAPEHGRTRKTRTVHRNLLLPFMCVSSTTDEVRAEEPPPSDEDNSDTEHESSANEQPEEDDDVDPEQRYVIPMRRRRGERGLLPRSTSRIDDAAGENRSRSSSSESDEMGSGLSTSRPQRKRKPPAWMTAGDFVLPQAQSQSHVFSVPREQVIWV